jgi:hypothetical protein
MSCDAWWTRVWTNVSLLVVAVVFCVVSLRGRTTVQQGARALHAKHEAGNMLSRVSSPSIGTTNGVVVLGMHRSGTSMLTGLMGEMRLHLGPQDTLLPPANGVNEKGFFERTQIVLQNSELMRAQNVSWNSNVTQFDHIAALVRRCHPRLPWCLRYAIRLALSLHPFISSTFPWLRARWKQRDIVHLFYVPSSSTSSFFSYSLSLSFFLLSDPLPLSSSPYSY